MLGIAKCYRVRLGVVMLLLVTLLNTMVFPSGVVRAAEEESTAKMVVSGPGSYYVVLREDRTVWTWGYNTNGELGDGTTNSRYAPAPVQGLTDVISIAGGGSHALAVKADGTVWAWGNNNYGQLGDGTPTTRHSPVQVTGLDKVVSVAAGSRQSFALREDGTVWAWGYNWEGQLGDGTKADQSVPVQVAGLTDVVSIVSGDSHAFAIQSNGDVWSWGVNNSSVLGDGTYGDRATPVRVKGLTGVKKISSKYNHVLALKDDGTVWSWGYNAFGQLGNNTTGHAIAPTAVSGLADVKTISANMHTSMVLQSDGTVWTWGNNARGQVGDGFYSNRKIPVRATLPKPATDVMAVDSGTSVVLLSDGTLWGAGEGSLWGFSKSAVFVQSPFFGEVTLTATATNSTTVNLSYGANVPITKYVVKRGTITLTCPQTGTDLSCQDRGVTPGTSYTYTVEAYDARGGLIQRKSQTVIPGDILDPRLTVESAQTKVSAGATFTTSVKVEQAVDLFAEDVTISYDPSLFSFVNAEPASTGLKIYRVIQQSGSVRFIVASQGAQHGLHDTAPLLNLTLKANNAAGKGMIAVSQGLVANSEGEEMVAKVGGTEVTVTSTDADVNNDGRISLGDLAIAGHHYGMDKTGWTYPKADIDGNDNVNDVDLSAIVEAIFNNAN